MSDENKVAKSENGAFMPDVAMTSIVGISLTVGITRVRARTSVDNPRNSITVHNTSSGKLYFGGPDLTVDNGMPLTNGVSQTLKAKEGVPLYLISDTASQDVRIAEAI